MTDVTIGSPRLIRSHMPQNLLEISVKGKWVKTPSLQLDGQKLIVTGRWVRIASLHDEDWVENEVKNPEECIQELRRSQLFHADILAFTQKVPETTPKYNYPLEWCSVAVVRTSNFKHWWDRLPQEGRKNVRRSQKRGVSIHEIALDDRLIRGIAEIQNETPIRQGRRYPHFGKSLAQVRKDYSPLADHSEFICAFFGEELIGLLQLVYRGKIASILQLNSKIAHHDKRASNALLARAVELCEANNITHLTYGKFNYGNKGDSSLREFKSRNGFEEMLVPRYYVPLNAWGAFCVKTRMYRGLVGILPKGIISVGSRIRAEWYDFKYTKAGVAQC